MDVQLENEDFGQDAILESLFLGCDTEGTGFVKVSKLIEYLTLAVTGDDVDFGGNLNELSMLLDPEGKDVAVDIKTYGEGMEDWIDGIRRRKYNEESTRNDNSITSYNIYPDVTEESLGLNCNENRGDPSTNYSSESVEGVGGESPQKQDWELVAKIENLQLNNKRLLDHNAELSFQMENTEETNAHLLQEVEELQKLLRSYQNLEQKSKVVEKENEELRQTVAELEERSKNFQNKAEQLEKDKLTLNESQEELRTKLASVNRRLESLSNDHKNVCLAYNEEKQKLIDLEELQVEVSIDKKPTDTQDYLSNVISELSAQKEALQMERNKMETELFQVREELARLTANTTSASTPELHRFYTPAKSLITANSLQQEIQELSFNDCLPSPLVGYNNYLDDAYENDVFETSLQSGKGTSVLSVCSLNSSGNSSFSSGKSSEALTNVNQMAVDFREKKDKALQAISEIIQLDKTGETKEIRECLQNELEKEMEYFAQKVWLLSLARKASEKRVSKLLASTGFLKEENKRLMEERDRAIRKIGNLSFGSEDLETRIETLTSELECTLEKVEKLEKRCAELQNEVDRTKNELQCSKSENQALKSAMEFERDGRKKAEKKLVEMERLHKDFKKENNSTLAKITRLEQEVERAKVDLIVERKRSFSLEESLSFSVSKHEEELQEIMETIPDVTYSGQRNIENGKLNSKPCVITAYQIRAKLRELLSNKHLTIRVIHDSKQASIEDDAPLCVSTPTDDSNIYLNSKQGFQRQPVESSKRPTNNSPNLSPTILTRSTCEGVKLETDEPQDPSWRSSCSTDSSLISPNLIRPFQSENNSLSSPSLINPFEKKAQECDADSSRSRAVPLESSTGEHSGNRDGESSRGASEFSSRNTEKDISVDVRRKLNLSIGLSTNQSLNEGQECWNDGDRHYSPTSPAIPLRFREITNIKTHSRVGVARSPPPIIQTELENDRRESSMNPDDGSEKSVDTKTNEDGKTDKDVGDKQRSVFSFDGQDIERCLVASVSSEVPSQLTSYSGDGDGIVEGHGSDYKSSAGIVVSYIDGVSFNANLPSDEEELEKLFKSVSLAFRTDKDTLPQRLEYQERARDTAETSVVKSLQCLSSSLEGLEKGINTGNTKQVLKDSLDSLCKQISFLKESSRQVSSKSHQFGCVQQEARMMAGVDVLINYGENLSRRFETLSESLSSQEAHEEHTSRSYNSTGDRRHANLGDQEVGSSRRGSAFYSFMSSMCAKDAFGLFGSNDEPRTATTSPSESRRSSTEQLNDANGGETFETLGSKSEEEQYFAITKKVSEERSCFNRCLFWSFRLIILLFLFVVFIFWGIRYSFIDRDFVVDQLHRNMKRFEVKHFGHEPAV